MAETKKATTVKAKATTKNVVYILAEIEKRKFDMVTGDRLSKPQNQTFNYEEWKQFQEHGPRQGWFVNKVIEAPAGVKTEYKNPGSK